jgi:hypothetical protein
MATMIKLCAEMRKAFQGDLEKLLGQVAKKYQLDEDELLAFAEEKRQEAVEIVQHAMMLTKVRKPRVKKEGEAAGPVCTARTAKGQPCNNTAMAGSQLCGVHSRKVAADSGAPRVVTPDSAQTPMAPKRPAVQVPMAPQKPKKAEHNHTVDEVPEEQCERCEEHGHPAVEQKYSVNRSLKQQLEAFRAQLLAENPEYEEEEEQPKPVPKPVLVPVQSHLVEYEDEDDDDDDSDDDSDCCSEA